MTLANTHLCSHTITPPYRRIPDAVHSKTLLVLLLECVCVHLEVCTSSTRLLLHAHEHDEHSLCPNLFIAMSILHIRATEQKKTHRYKVG